VLVLLEVFVCCHCLAYRITCVNFPLACLPACLPGLSSRKVEKGSVFLKNQEKIKEVIESSQPVNKLEEKQIKKMQ
jgi:hypothetical protein